MSDENHQANGLPGTLSFDTVFVSVFWELASDRYGRLQENDPDSYSDKDEFDVELSNAIGETLTALGLEEPSEEGGSLEWLGHLHELLEPRLTKLMDWERPEDGADADEPEGEGMRP